MRKIVLFGVWIQDFFTHKSIVSEDILPSKDIAIHFLMTKVRKKEGVKTIKRHNWCSHRRKPSVFFKIMNVWWKIVKSLGSVHGVGFSDFLKTLVRHPVPHLPCTSEHCWVSSVSFNTETMLFALSVSIVERWNQGRWLSWYTSCYESKRIWVEIISTLIRAECGSKWTANHWGGAETEVLSGLLAYRSHRNPHM